MGATASLLPEFEDVVQHGSAGSRRRCCSRSPGCSWKARAAQWRTGRVVRQRLGCSSRRSSSRRGPSSARRLAPVPNPPDGVVQRAGQERRHRGRGAGAQSRPARGARSQEIAETKSQATSWPCRARRHRRGADRHSGRSAATARSCAAIATNCRRAAVGGRLPHLVKRAEQDGVLAEKVGLRTDIPPRMFRKLLMQASEVVQKRLLAQAKPETQAEIRRVLAKVTDEVAAKAAPRNYTAALRRRARAAQGAQAERGRPRGLCRDRQVRGDHRRACDAVRRAGRSGRSPDGRRARRSGVDPGARRRIRLADRARDHDARPRPEAEQRTSSMRPTRISNG